MDDEDLLASGRFAEAVKRLNKAHSSRAPLDAVADTLLDWPAMGVDVLNGVAQRFDSASDWHATRSRLTAKHAVEIPQRESGHEAYASNQDADSKQDKAVLPFLTARTPLGTSDSGGSYAGSAPASRTVRGGSMRRVSWRRADAPARHGASVEAAAIAGVRKAASCDGPSSAAKAAVSGARQLRSVSFGEPTVIPQRPEYTSRHMLEGAALLEPLRGGAAAQRQDADYSLVARRSALKLAQQLEAVSIPEAAELPVPEAEAVSLADRVLARSAVPRPWPPPSRSTRASSMPAHSLAAASSRMEAIIASTQLRSAAEDTAVSCDLQVTRNACAPQVQAPDACSTTVQAVVPPQAEAAAPAAVRKGGTFRRSASARVPGEHSKLDAWALHPLCGAFTAAGEMRQEDTEADWAAVLEAMQLRREQLEEVAEARVALEQTLLPIWTKKEVLTKTLCSFAGVEADSGIEDAVLDCKKELRSLDDDEQAELRAFRCQFRLMLAAPLLKARQAIAEAACGRGIDMISVGDHILALVRGQGWQPRAEAAV